MYQTKRPGIWYQITITAGFIVIILGNFVCCMMMMMNDEMGKGTYMFTVMAVADFIGTVLIVVAIFRMSYLLHKLDLKHNQANIIS